MQPERLIQLKPEEEILEVVHESLMPWLPKFGLSVVILALPFFFLFPLFREGTWGILVFSGVLLLGIVLTWRSFFIWSRSVLIVTDKRVIDHDQAGFFSRVITESRHKKIDDVTYRIKGVIATLFRFGSINIRLQGNAADIEFSHAFRPARIVDLINDLREENEEEESLP